MFLIRWIKNIVWLLNHPPIGLTNGVKEGATCDYCGSGIYLEDIVGLYCICHQCKKKVFDKVLLRSENR